jgi:U4/U6.U5 tri-snRNP-associated protein 2
MEQENLKIDFESNKMINKKRYRDITGNIFIDKKDIITTNEVIDTFTNNSHINSKIKQNTDCPYLGTIKRHLLDFDFEKVCSISLSNMNVYACLVCGKYYQGRGINTDAYTHSLEVDHHMFINLQDQKIYCLPENYEVVDNSLNDIKFNLKPTFNKKDIENLEKTCLVSKALDGTEFYPGCIGLNNIKRTDYVNVIIQSLCRVTELRNYFLKYDDNTTDLVRI